MSYGIGSTTAIKARTRKCRGSRWNFLAICSRTGDMPGGRPNFTPPPLPANVAKQTVAGTGVS